MWIYMRARMLVVVQLGQKTSWVFSPTLQAELLQTVAQCVAADSQALCCARLVPAGLLHGSFDHGALHFGQVPAGPLRSGCGLAPGRVLGPGSLLANRNR